MGRRQDFTKSVIYHIRHTENKEVVYVGSTTKFSQRKGKHKYNCNNEERKEFKYPIYCHIRDNGGFNCFEVIPIKILKLENKTELLILEQEEMDKYRTLVNSRKAHMPIDIEEKRIYHNERNKKWYENNPEKLKKYREEHKEDKKQYNKQYREENNENINESIKCPICNSNTSRHNLKRHQRTKKCQEYLGK